MPEKHEIPDLGPGSPVRFFIQNIETTSMHRHPCVELIYISSGSALATVKAFTWRLKEDDLLLVNPYEVHSLKGSGCTAAIFQIYLNRFHKHVLPKLPLLFDCNSSLTSDKSQFLSLKRLLARLVKHNTSPDAPSAILNESLSYALLYELITSFGITECHEDKDTAPVPQRMEEILNYINSHYQEKLSLNLLADHFFLTVPYLSRLFKRNMGINFSEYLTSLRLCCGVQDLLHTDASIEAIAEKNGFPNSRSFVAAFKDSYGELPSSYRREKLLSLNNSALKSVQEPSNYFTFQQHNNLGSLAQYLNETNLPPISPAVSIKKVVSASVSLSQKGLPLRHTFKTIAAIGKLKHMLIAENQNMLRQLQRDVGFTYIKFHGLLDDDMMVYSETGCQEPELSFTCIDMAFDFLLSIGLKPLMQLSFMPKALAATPDRTMFYTASVISLPKDMKKWAYLIEQLVLHLETRYGSREVASWPFYLWNEPDSPMTMFGFDDHEAFFEFYRITYETVKRLNPDIAFGSPSCMYSTLADGSWMKEFMHYCKKHDCVPSFFNFNFYPISLEDNPSPNLPQRPQLVLAKSGELLRDTIHQIRKTIREQGWNTKRLYLTEWNSSVSHRDLLNDTAFKAAYVVKNILENYDRLDSFGYWVVSDFMEEVKLADETYHGGLGLFTVNGIKKPPYHAFALLARLGNTLIGRGEGYFVTKQDGCVQIMLYHYQHYSALYAAGELFDMTFTDRYTPFVNPGSKHFTIPLTDLANDSWMITETFVNQEHGSSFDSWVAFGALPLETQSEIDYLKSVSVPGIRKRKALVKHGILSVQAELKPHEIRLIELRPCQR